MNVIKKIGIEGLTLLEMMIAAGIAALLALGVSQFLIQGAKIQKTVDTTTEINSFLLEIGDILRNPENCAANFIANSDPPAWNNLNAISVQKPGGIEVKKDFLAEKNHYARKGFAIDRMELINTTPVSNVVELKFSFSKVGKFTPLGGLKISRSLFLPIKLEGTKFVACFSQFPEGPSKLAIAKAVEKSCGPGTIYNGNVNDPQCILDSTVTSLMNCPDKYFITKVVLTGTPGSYRYTTTCFRPFECPSGKVGILVGDQLQCINKCASDQVAVYDNTGFKCKRLQCSTTPGSIQYMAGVDTSGNPICKNLVDSAVSCGSNGWKFIQDTAGGSVKASCCASCNPGGSYCTDQIYQVTSDCQIPCYGTSTKIAYTYSGWSTCQRDATSGFCEQSRTLTCTKTTTPLPTETTHYCCDKPTPAQSLHQTCTTGNYNNPVCSTGQTPPYNASPSCTAANGCCDPNSRGPSVNCPGRTYNGNHTYTDCTNAGGSLMDYGGNKWCFFASGSCPGGWSRGYAKTNSNTVCGGNHSFCTANCCVMNGSGGNWVSSPHSCTYCTYQDYMTWGVYCYCGGSVQGLSAPAYEVLCY